jgi:hypothetical protein
LEIIHKLSLYSVLAFVFVAAVISLAGPETIAAAQPDNTLQPAERALTAAGVPHTAHGPGI